jgi:hypothetical protein
MKKIKAVGWDAKRSKRRAAFTPPLRRFTKPGDGGVNSALRLLFFTFHKEQRNAT